MPEDQLDAWLRRERSQGRLDSHGRFELDFQKALETVGRCRLPSPYYCQHKLVQAAVALGCQQVELAEREACETWLLGVGLTSELLLELPHHLLSSGPQRGLGHLATGLHAAIELGANRVELESWTPSEGSLLVFGDERTELKTGLPPLRAEPGLCLRVVNGFFSTILDAGKFGWHRGAGSFAHCGIPVTSNGELENWLPRSQGRRADPQDIPLPDPTRWERFLLASQPGPDLIPGPCVAAPLRSFRQVAGHEVCDWPSDSPVPARVSGLTVAGQPAAGCLAQLFGTWGGSAIKWVHDGVLIETTWDETLPAPCELVVSTRGLQTDLSGFKLVRDEAYRTMIELLARQVREACA